MQGLDDLLLDRADVLVLVDEQGVESAGQLLCHLRLPEQPEAEVLQVVVIQHVLFALQLLEPVLDVPGQLIQAPGQQSGLAVVLQGLPVVGWQPACGGLHLLLPPVPQVEVGLLGFLVVQVRLFPPRQGGETDGTAPEQALFGALPVFLQQGAVGLEHFFKALRRQGVPEQLFAAVQGALRFPQLLLRHGQQQAEGRQGFQRTLIRRGGAFGPFPGVGHGQQEAAQPVGHGQDGVRGGGIEQVFLLLRRRGIGCLHRLLGSLVQQPFQHRVVADAGEGIDAQQFKMLADHPLAESMQGGDFRPVHPLLLAVEVRVARFLFQGVGDALSHFRCGGAGEGDDQHAGDVSALPEHAQHPRHEHRGLAGARGGADQQFRLIGLYGVPLFWCPVHVSVLDCFT